MGRVPACVRASRSAASASSSAGLRQRVLHGAAARGLFVIDVAHLQHQPLRGEPLARERRLDVSGQLARAAPRWRRDRSPARGACSRGSRCAGAAPGAPAPRRPPAPARRSRGRGCRALPRAGSAPASAGRPRTRRRARAAFPRVRGPTPGRRSTGSGSRKRRTSPGPDAAGGPRGRSARRRAWRRTAPARCRDAAAGRARSPRPRGAAPRSARAPRPRPRRRGRRRRALPARPSPSRAGSRSAAGPSPRDSSRISVLRRRACGQRSSASSTGMPTETPASSASSLARLHEAALPRIATHDHGTAAQRGIAPRSTSA